jgi:hypothetical protein
MPARNEPQLQGLDAILSAVRDSGTALRQRYDGQPVELAARFHLLLPDKPVKIMLELGVITEEEAIKRFGDYVPGLRELVVEVCMGLVESAAVVGPRGGGKALATSTPIPTPSGWKFMGDLVEGDEVFAADGTVCKVIDAWPVIHQRPCYEVEFGDGSRIVADADHRWVARKSWGASRVVTTTQLGAGGFLVDSALPLCLPWRDLPVDPYWFGYWLGDGDSTQALISVGRQDIDEVQTMLGGVRIPDKNGNYRLRFTELHRVLRAMGVAGDKHIPRAFKRAATEQRLALLQGLMDSDGTIRKHNNNCQFAVQNEALALGCAELVASLGWKYTIRKKDVGPDWNRAASYVVSFRPTEQVFRLSRKATRLNLNVTQTSRHTSRSIRTVREVVSVPVRCIAVDHPSRLFLAGKQMVPTHNSQGVSFIEFYMVFIRLFDALNLGGSELQADQVYQYLLGYIDSDPYWKALIKGNAMRERTYTTDNAWIRVLTASSKSVRSPHAGGRKKDGRLAGGILVIDEEAEAEADIVSAALPTINTAVPSVNVRSSTFHNAAGSFADLIDSHEEMGYKLYKWDVFDVCSGCNCPPDPTGEGQCMSSELCFREDHIETFHNPDTGQQEERVLHRAYCGGRARYANGWVPMEEILKLWKRLKRNHSTWEVEQMGSRPTSRGYVIEDRNKFRANITDESARSLFVPGCATYINVDWGTGRCGIEVWQDQGDRHVLLECELLEETGPTETIARIVSFWQQYANTFAEVRGDLGGGGNYMNKTLTEQYGLPAADVPFSECKEAAVRVWNILNEAGQIVIPREHALFIEQTMKWRRKNGRIDKGNDHLCDSAICYFSRYIDTMGLSHIRIGPKVFHTIAEQPENMHLGHTLMGSKATAPPAAGVRVPVAIGFGRGKR